MSNTVAYLARDDSSKSSNSYTSHSITSILSFEIEEIEVRKPTAEVAAPNKETIAIGSFRTYSGSPGNKQAQPAKSRHKKLPARALEIHSQNEKIPGDA